MTRPRGTGKKKVKTIFRLTDADLKYHSGVDYTHDSYGCSGRCDKDDHGVCRCSQYEGLRVKIDLGGLAFALFPSVNEVTRYVIERVMKLSGIGDSYNWVIDVMNGYYGEEIRSIHLNSTIAESVQSALDNIVTMTLDEQINTILQLEYGAFFRPVCAVSLETVDIKSIFIPNPGYLKIVDGLPLAREEFPIAVCIQEGHGIRLIDGYHRYKDALQKNQKKIKVLTAMWAS